MTDIPTTPADRRRRRLAAFARSLVQYLGRDAATRRSIEAIARSLGDTDPRDRDAAIDAMDELLDGTD